MMYDLGQVSLMSRFSRFFIIFGTLLVSGLITCILFAIMVRIGNAILGW